MFDTKQTKRILYATFLSILLNYYKNKKDLPEVDEKFELNLEDFFKFLAKMTLKAKINENKVPHDINNINPIFEKEKLFKQIIQNQEWNRIPELGEIFAKHRDFFKVLFKKFRKTIQ